MAARVVLRRLGEPAQSGGLLENCQDVSMTTEVTLVVPVDIAHQASELGLARLAPSRVRRADPGALAALAAIATGAATAITILQGPDTLRSFAALILGERRRVSNTRLWLRKGVGYVELELVGARNEEDILSLLRGLLLEADNSSASDTPYEASEVLPPKSQDHP